MNISSTGEAFIKQVSSIGALWGFNRTVAQIFALLYISDNPLTADDMMKTLGCSRSNVSIGLKELQSWRLARRHHVAGDRREYFSAPDECWQIFRLLAEERKRRDIDPTLAMLRNLLSLPAASEQERHVQTKLHDMHVLLETMTDWFIGLQSRDRACEVEG